MKVDIYNQEGKEAGKMELPGEIFDLPWSGDLVNQVVLAMQANKRVPVAHVKDRGEVRGGGKKPWRQKGTGRARHGSIRSPIWRGGGVTHGPTKERTYLQKINKKMKRKAFLVVVSQKLRDNEVLFLDKIILSQPKTKEANAIVSSLSKIKGFEKLASKKKNRAVIALPQKDNNITRSFRNLPGVEVCEARNLNVLNLLSGKYLILVSPDEKIFSL